MNVQDELLRVFTDFQNSLGKYKEQLIKNPILSKLTVNQIHYLETINFLESPMVSEISETLKVSKASATVAINKLINLGYVKKFNSDKDKRVFFVELTPEGRDIVKLKDVIFRDFIQDIISRLDMKEVEYFIEIFNKINNGL